MQAAVGREEVRRKKVAIRKFKNNKAKLDRYLKKKRVPIVIGPGGKFHLLDHHHTVMALFEEGIRKVYYESRGDLSSLSPQDFWKEVISRHWVRLVDEKGKSIRWEAIDKLTSIEDIKNDPYRSLAGIVRDKGGFKKLDIPFMEFEWADFFRGRMDMPGKKISWKRAIEQGMKLARSDAAKALPGYIEKKK